MADFVKVMTNDGGKTQTEIIKTEDLCKVVKWFGDEETAICFEWYCRISGRRKQWVYECDNQYLRDEMFAKYEELLTGKPIAERRIFTKLEAIE